MLHVTNNTMKKTTIIISALVLFVLATAGCEDAYKASQESNNDNSIGKTEILMYEPPKTIIEVVEGLDSNTYIVGLMSVEPIGTQMQVAFTQPYNDVDRILTEYNQAREKQLNLLLDSNYSDIVQFENSGFDNMDESLEALRAEKIKLEGALETQVDNSLLVRQITVVTQKNL